MGSGKPKSWRVENIPQKQVNIEGFDELSNKIYRPLRDGLKALTEEEKDEYLHLLDGENNEKVKEHARLVYNIYTQVCDSINKERSMNPEQQIEKGER